MISKESAAGVEWTCDDVNVKLSKNYDSLESLLYF
jgi:hypothetical protein